MLQRIQRRSLRASVALVALAIGFVLLSSSADAQGSEEDMSGQVRILEVSGLLDDVVFDFLIKEIDQAEADGILAIVLQIDSKASVLGPTQFIELATRLQDSEVLIAAWVGPAGAVALAGTAELVGVADMVGLAQGSRIGETGNPRLPIGAFDPAFGTATERLQTVAIGAAESVELEISVGQSGSEDVLRESLETNSVLRQFVGLIDGFEAPTATTETAAGLGQAQFRQLTMSGQLFHTVASPEVAYLFFFGGMMLLVFELFTAGVGVAGVIGVGLFTLGSYGLSALPTRSIGVALLVAAIAAFAIDIQTNIPRLYSAVGMVLFVVGTFVLYDGLTISWVTIIFGFVAAALYAYTGMPSMVRTRFSSPTIGRSWMIGELGQAITELKPDGTVRIQDAPWRAITNRATPLEAGDTIRVIGIDRMVLEVEPEEGGAKDYRDRS